MSFDFLPESATAPPAAKRRYLICNLAIGAVLAVCLLVLLRGWGGPGAAVAAFLGLIAAFVGGFYEFARLISALDEMQRRIHTLALACSGGLTAMGLTLWGFAAEGLGVAPPDALLAAPVFILGYYLCLMFVARRFT